MHYPNAHRDRAREDLKNAAVFFYVTVLTVALVYSMLQGLKKDARIHALEMEAPNGPSAP